MTGWCIIPFPIPFLLSMLPDMHRKPKPLPLSVSQAKIEKEKLEVLKRTEKCISDIRTFAADNN